MNNKRLIVASRGFNTGEVFKTLFDEVINLPRYSKWDFKEGDVLILEGGTDINSYFYDEEPNSYVSYPDQARDAYEQMLFNQSKNKGIPVIGICRGAQLVCALSGGKLVQHISNHDVDHTVKDYKGRSFIVTSSHHQMMLPDGTKHKVLASCKRSSTYIGEYDKPMNVEEDVEIVWFEDTKSLAIQGHPEWAGMISPFVAHCQEYVRDYIQGNLFIQGEVK
ncbi:MAG: gamma-glutamyl-gamma-aminobutyrate hydrolase family protein [Sulfurimonas sp.]|jgi:GMP synthase-like glutamine amidotransferase|nr:gamma-glutamyl-gamma-aminobutyrate hydrolase family protein [Sulfurimonas sp.]